MNREAITRDRVQGQVFRRELRLDAASLNAEDRTISASLSSEQPVERWFGVEVLQHTKDAIDLSRAEGGLPLLYNHNTQRLIGSVRDVQLVDGKLRGTLHFGRSTDALERWQDVQDGHLRSMSIGYEISEWVQQKGSETVTVTRWALLEASAVPVPADSTVGIGRSKEETPMPKEVTNTPADPEVITEVRGAVSARAEADKKAGAKAERTRTQAIMSRFENFIERGPEYLALRDKCIADGVAAERAADALLAMLSGDSGPVVEVPSITPERAAVVPGSSEFRSNARITGGVDVRETFSMHASIAIACRAGFATPEQQAQLRGSMCEGLTLSELAREFLRAHGQDVRGNVVQVVGRALTYRSAVAAAGVDDFTGILLNASNKAMMRGWVENPETWQIWTGQSDASDFKQFNRLNLSTFGDLDVVPENGEYKYGKFSDIREYSALKTYGKLFSISRQAIINDDMNAFTTIPMLMGRAAARMVGDEAYAILSTGTSTAMKQDSVNLFDASTHKNYVTVGAAPSVTTVDAGRAAMAIQTDPAGNTLNITPRYLITPRALETTAAILSSAQYDPAASAGTLKPNPFQNKIVPVADARLDTFNSQGWFLAADPSMCPTVEVVFLQGQRSPYMEEQQGFTVDGASYKVRLDVVALAVDFRGLYYNDGA